MRFKKLFYKQPAAAFLALLGFVLLSQFVYAHGMSEAEKQSIIEGGNLRYMQLGMTHMLSGYDHLAFVFGIIFFLTSFREIAKYVTAFTVGHSVTLIYATFNAIQVNYFLIDAVIGLSVSYIAFTNLDGFKKYLGMSSPNMMFMIAGLGLIHGFGLSTRLQALPLSEDQLLLNIISFNVGIELGQISALALMLVLISTWRKRQSFKTFSLLANYTLIFAGLYLFLMQMHGYAHISHPEEFMVSKTALQPEAADTTEVTTDVTDLRSDVISIVIPARGSKEYKFFIEKGGNIDYDWSTDGASLFFDFHGEPAGDETGYFESFKKDTARQSAGSLTTRFSGTHGWYWENKTALPVTITLNSKGSYQRIDLNGTSTEIEVEAESTQKPVSQTRESIY